MIEKKSITFQYVGKFLEGFDLPEDQLAKIQAGETFMATRDQWTTVPVRLVTEVEFPGQES